MYTLIRPSLRALARLCLAVSILAPKILHGAEPGAKPPFHVLYDNDLTNIVGCPSPYNPKGAGFQESMLRASVDETADTGIDVHLLQPGLGWVPWWPSKVLPMAEHLRYLERAGRKPDSFERYVAQGGDLVKVFVEACRAKHEHPFLSVRMNDAHHIRRGLAEKDPARQEEVMAEFQMFVDHPELRLGSESPDPSYRNLFDWAHGEVRDYKLSLLRELCENYDLDGLELDFMRHPILFQKGMPVAERREIVAGFIHQVRMLLDRTAAPDRHRWLGVHIPGYRDQFDELGIDLMRWSQEGVELVNLSGYYFIDQQMEIGAIREQLPPNVALYAEIHYASAVRTIAEPPFFALRRSTDAEIYSTAHLAYARGADGISAFNFQYYRGTTNKNDVAGTPAEPPFHVFNRLADRDWLGREPQEAFVGAAWGKPYRKGRLRNPKSPMQPGTSETIALDVTPRIGGWTKPGRLRIQSETPLKESRWKVTINGTALEPTTDVSEPSPNPYDVAVGTPEDYRAWIVSPAILRDGTNEITMTLEGGSAAQIFFLDLAMP